MVKRMGKIVGEVNPYLEIHEWKTINFLLSFGFNIEFIKIDRKEGAKNPDIKLDGCVFEMKSPKGVNSRTLENTIRDAVKQAENIVIDLRRTKRSDQRCLQEAENRFLKVKRIKRLYLITKKNELKIFKR